MAVILVLQNNETAAMLVYQTNPVEVEHLVMYTLSFVQKHLHGCWTRECIRSIQGFSKSGINVVLAQ